MNLIIVNGVIDMSNKITHDKVDAGYLKQFANDILITTEIK